MWFPFVCEIVLLGVLVSLLLRRYIDWKTTPLYVYCSTWIGWLMCFGIVCLVPVDILASNHTACIAEIGEQQCPEPITYIQPHALEQLWRGMYWTAFFLTWIIYPVSQSYALAGDFTIIERLREALHANILFYAIAAVAGLGGLVWLLAIQQLDWSTIVGLVMAVANTWGIILLIALMGYGLVEIPRWMWLRANRELTLRHYQFQTVALYNATHNTWDDLLKTLKTVKAYDDKIKRHDPFRLYIDVIISKCPALYNSTEVINRESSNSRVSGLLGNIIGGNRDGPEVVTEVYYSKLVTLHNKLKMSVFDAERAGCLYTEHLRKTYRLQDIISNYNNSDHVIAWTFQPRRIHKFAWYIDRVEWFWLTRLYPVFMRLCSLFFALLSLVIVWSQVTAFVQTPDLSIFSWFVKWAHMKGLLLQSVVFLALAYEALCAYSTLFKIRIFNFYRLIPHQQTDSNSIMFSAAYLCRLAAPLSFNFINFLHQSVTTSFSKVMGKMDVVPFLGNNFSIYFPILVVVICLLTLFNVGTKILTLFKIKQFKFEDDFNDQQIDEGRKILADDKEARELLPLERAFPTSHVVSESRLDATRPGGLGKGMWRVMTARRLEEGAHDSGGTGGDSGSDEGIGMASSSSSSSSLSSSSSSSLSSSLSSSMDRDRDRDWDRLERVRSKAAQRARSPKEPPLSSSSSSMPSSDGRFPRLFGAVLGGSKLMRGGAGNDDHEELLPRGSEK